MPALFGYPGRLYNGAFLGTAALQVRVGVAGSVHEEEVQQL
jgi:hypothetical protein